MNRYGVALAAELKRSSKEPYELLRFAWLAAIEPYQGVDPTLHAFHLSSGIIETACKVYALFPLDTAMRRAATMTAAISYPAFSETADGRSAWAVLRNTLDVVKLNPGLFNETFKKRNPNAFESTFHGTPFTPAQAQEMLQVLSNWAKVNGVRLG